MKILISTGIYPPEVGGPAKYATSIKELWQKEGHEVFVHVFSRFNYLPTGIRHLFYLFSILPSVVQADFILVLDTFSAALPTVIASLVFGKKVVVRVGGDFLWESFVERSGERVLLKDFYNTNLSKLSSKEKFIFSSVKFVLNKVDAVVWSTEWQKNLSIKPYSLENQTHFVVENYYGDKKNNTLSTPQTQIFLASSRDIKLKNLDILRNIFNKKESKIPKGVELFTFVVDSREFIKKMEESYAVVVVSLSEVSPNMILEAIRLNKPFICTKEVGIFDRIKEIGIFVDPLNEAEVENAVLKLINKDEYQKYLEKIKNFSFVHSWEDIGKEFLGVYEKIK